jgi:hypothetical protein
MNEQIPPVNYTGTVPCDWCGSWSQCDECAVDPKVAERMHHLCWVSNDNPMDEAEGGHIHACCEAHELYWKDAHFATSLEGVEPEEIVAMLPKLEGIKRLIAFVSITDNDPDHCGCVVDEDGSTITACREHPEGGSPKGTSSGRTTKSGSSTPSCTATWPSLHDDLKFCAVLN